MKELWPLVELGGSADTPAIIGALYHPHDGHIAPGRPHHGAAQGRAQRRR